MNAAGAPLRRQVGEAVETALDEALAAAPEVPARQYDETVLVGEGGLESLALITFTGILEEHLVPLGVTVSVIDVVLSLGEPCTAGDLTASLITRAGLS